MTQKGKYMLSSLFVVVSAGIYMTSCDFSACDRHTQVRILCDALTVPGVLLLCAGGLLWASQRGALDGLSYGLTLAARGLIPGKRLRREESYREFVARKRCTRSGGYGFLLITGSVTTTLSLLFLALYYL